MNLNKCIHEEDYEKSQKIVFPVLILTFLSLFTGCMSRGEKQKANKYVAEAKSHLTQYLSEHYPDAISKSIEDVTQTTYQLYTLDNTHATSAVRMTYEDAGEEYHIIYDVNTGFYYEDRSCDEITDALWAELQKLCDFYDFQEWEISFCWNNEEDEAFSENYYRVEEDTLEDLLDGNYEFTVTVKYEESQTDLSELDLSAFASDWNLTFLFTDYVEGHYNVDSGKNTPYAIRQYRKEVFGKDSSGSQESRYQKYDRLSIHDMEFVWPSNFFAVSATTEDAPRELVPGAYSNATFISTDDMRVRLHIQEKDEAYTSEKIYVFSPMERENQRVILRAENSSEYDTWKLEWREDDHIYRWFSVYSQEFTENAVSYTFGYYEMEE
ncbi:MAG: hypothetical protein LUC50_02215 [Ruminococcus sp.]|nr:hypothetical protein [Ruminococcus sp.]